MKEDHELGKDPPDQGIRYLKRYTIYVKSDNLTPAKKLRFEIIGYTKEDRDESGGTPVSSVAKAYELIDVFLKDDRLQADLVRPDTPLDFAIQEPCIITLKLLGDFWEFSTANQVKTKDVHQDDRYYYLRPHTRSGRIAAVSFCAKDPLPAGDNQEHGINLYVDFLQDLLRLPVVVDPDIENKGKN